MQLSLPYLVYSWELESQPREQVSSSKVVVSGSGSWSLGQIGPPVQVPLGTGQLWTGSASGVVPLTESSDELHPPWNVWCYLNQISVQ